MRVRHRLVRRKLGGLASLKGVCAALRGFRCQSWLVRRRPSSVVCVCVVCCVCVCLSFVVRLRLFVVLLVRVCVFVRLCLGVVLRCWFRLVAAPDE